MCIYIFNTWNISSPSAARFTLSFSVHPVYVKLILEYALVRQLEAIVSSILARLNQWNAVELVFNFSTAIVMTSANERHQHHHHTTFNVDHI